MDTSEAKTPESEKPPLMISGLTQTQIGQLLKSCVGLMVQPVEPESLHGVLRLVLRLTRDNLFAKTFADLGGTGLLLQLTKTSDFPGFTSLAMLIFRHIFEDEKTLMHTMEKVKFSLS